jgi:hypothetical protein
MPVGGCAYWWESHYSLVQGHSPLKPFAVLPYRNISNKEE